MRLFASEGSSNVIREILDARSEFALFGTGINVFMDVAKKYLLYDPNNTEVLANLNKKNITGIESIKIGSIDEKIIMLNSISTGFSISNKPKDIQYIFVSDKNIENKKILKLWNNIYLTEFEDDVINIIQIIEPRIKSIGFVDDLRKQGNRVPMVRLSTSKTPVLLSSMGEGMNRMLGIALALVNSKDGLLLIDEIDNGVHYSVQPDLWRLIFEGARRMNVQVFVPLHIAGIALKLFSRQLRKAAQMTAYLSVFAKRKKRRDMLSVLSLKEKIWKLLRETESRCVDNGKSEYSACRRQR